MIEIALLKSHEYADATALLKAQFAEHDIQLQDGELLAAVRGLIDAEARRGAILLARDGDVGVGLAVLAYTWTLEHGGFVAWLDELYVQPTYRAQGLGTRLLDAALKAARQAGCLALDLEVDAGHQRVVSLYERHGFSALKRARFARRL